MSFQKSKNQPFYKNTLIKVILCTLVAWIVIYVAWAQYPQRLMHNDIFDSNQQNQKAWIQTNWKGIPYKIPEPSELKGNSYYNSLGDKYGTYGDMYGSLNTLFSGLAFATLIISLILQMLELSATRKELAEQKDALIGQQAEFQKQTQILSKQIKIAEDQKGIADNQHTIINAQFIEAQKKNFSDQFYSLLAERNNLLSHMTVVIDGKEFRGFQVIVLYAEKFREIRSEFIIEEHDNQFFKDKWYSFTEFVYGSKTYQMQSYFKLYRLLFSMINNAMTLNDSEKNMYFQIIKNFIDVEEKFILMWLGCFYGSFQTMCNKYALLDGIHHSKLECIGLNFFDISAFGNSKSWKKTFEDSVDLDTQN
ncbi:hypothetical protein [Acinetobacter bereziniae]|uniref:hypothetical protein n=1 Tax=Acinetobacter bereziniae TaxID=106648 RepID=UPI0035714EA4